MSLTVADLVAKLGLDASEFDKGMDKSQKKSMTWGDALQKSQKVAAVGLAAVTGLIVGGVKAYGDLTSSIGALQRQTKISAEDASLLVGEWQRYGVSIEQGTTATVMLSKGMETAQAAAAKTQAEIAGLDKGSKTYGDQLSTLQAKLVGNAGAFGQLGISLQEVATLSPADMLEEVRQKLSEMPAGAERTAIAAKLLGRGFQGLSKWINASKGDLSAVDQQIKDTGQVMSTSELAKAKDDAKKMAELQLQWRGFMVEVGRAAMPAMEKLVPALKKLLEVVRPLAPHLVEIAGALAGFLVVTKAAQSFTILVGALHTLKGLVVGGKLASGLAGVVGAAGTGGAGFVTTAGGQTVAQSLLSVPTGDTFTGGAALAGASKGNAALTASNLGGKGVPIFAAGGVGLPVTIIGMTAAVGVGLAVALATYKEKPDSPGGVTVGGTPQGGPTGAGTKRPDTGPTMDYMLRQNAAAINASIKSLSAQAVTQTGAAFSSTLRQINQLHKLAAKKIVLGKIDGAHTDAELRTTRDHIMAALHITQKAADRIMATMFKDWRPQDQLVPKINRAAAAAENRIAILRQRAGRNIHMGNLDATNMINEIGRVSAALGGVRGAARTAGNAVANALGAKSGVQSESYRGYFMAAGGYVPARPGGTPVVLGEGGEGEYVTPASKMGGGGTVLNINVANVHGTDRAAATKLANMAGEIFMQQVRFA